MGRSKVLANTESYNKKGKATIKVVYSINQCRIMKERKGFRLLRKTRIHV
jgi:hypothetical protein